MTLHERNLARKESRKRKKTEARKAFSEIISVGDICVLNPSVVKSIYVAMDEGGYDKRNNKCRNLLMFFNIEVPKGQQLKIKNLLLVEKQKDSGIVLQYSKYRILKQEGKLVDSFTIEAQEEVFMDVAPVYKNKFGNILSARIKKTLILFDTALFNEGFEFYVDNIIRLKNAKRKKNPTSDTMIEDASSWNNKILPKINANEYKHIRIDQLYAACYDAYADLVLLIPVLFLVKKEEQDG